jgi:hypothetical protein
MSIFDGNTRAGMTSYQAAMQKGMPPDQAEAYTHGLDVLGILDYTNLPAVLNQFQRLKQRPAQSPNTPNVAQQIQMLANAAPSGRGLGAISPGATSYAPPAMDPMMRGIGSMDAGAMENPRGFNAGGIVAFSGEGNNQLVQSPAPPIVAANLPKPPADFSTPEAIARYYGDIFAQGRVPIYENELKQLRDLQKEEGIGEYAQSLIDEGTLLDTQEKRSVEELEQDRADLRRQEAADIAKAASGSRSLLEAMSKARSPAVERERTLEKEIRKARAEREKARIDLLKAKEQKKEATTTAARTAADTKINNAEARALKANETISDRVFQRQQEQDRKANNLAVAAFEASRRMGVARFERETAMKVAEAEARIKAGQGTSTDYVLGGELAKRIALEAQLRKETDPAKKAAIQKEIDAVATSIEQITSAITGTKVRPGSQNIGDGARPLNPDDWTATPIP